MPAKPSNPPRSKTQILENIDRKLNALPRTQQNMVALFAQGIQVGLALQTAAEACAEGDKERPAVPAAAAESRRRATATKYLGRPREPHP